ncbi:hypothetical protein K4W79_00040, partial [Pseudomonas aeruginosa]|nr:hypothetical protein [Pseudomonas aeruginosa]
PSRQAQLELVPGSEVGGSRVRLKGERDKPWRVSATRNNDGYSNALVALANPDDVTVPAKAGIRQTFVFEGGAEGIKAVRLWGKDLP